MHKYDEISRFFAEQLNTEIEKIKSEQPENLYQPVIYSLENGGKRIRPVLLLMAHEMFDPSFDKSINAAIAIEMFHNFTLLHDDIMDNANLRRNKETVHIKFSNNAAILSGDAMSILSYDYLNKCETPNFKEIFKIFTKTAIEICEGQQYDMDFETRNNVSVNEYLKMIGLKTAVLLASSLKIGALMANAPAGDAQLLNDFGYNMGMAFQLQDDYLDSFGDKSSFGKKIGGDIAANKKTYLMLKALELAKGEQKKQLEQLITIKDLNNHVKVNSVISIYKQLNIESHSRALMENYYKKAIECMEEIQVATNKKNELLNIAEKMMKRVS
jgi:geranylgeranyl diphosphate synthase type II